MSLRELGLTKEKLIEKIKEAKKLKGSRNFKQSVELVIAIKGLDLKKPENRFLLTISLPKGLSKKRRVCVFGDGPYAEEAKRQGADEVILKSQIEMISGKRREIKKIAKKYDFFIAQPTLMGLIGRVFGFALGPRGKMPVIESDPSKISERINVLRNSIRINVRHNPEACCIIGIEDDEDEDLAENALTVISEVYNKIRDKAKIGRIYIKTTMGKPVKVL